MCEYDFIKKLEGLRLKSYKDKFGNLTIGYGRNLDDKGISEVEADILFDFDVISCVKDLHSIFYDFFNYPLEVRQVLVSMMFNLGKKRFLTFKKFIKAIKEKNYEEAIKESYNSKRFYQVSDRVEFEINLLKEVLE
jgi:lysozyme